jgi:hypothetical protein
MKASSSIRSGLIALITLILICSSKPAHPIDFPDISGKLLDEIPSLDSFLEEKPAITTSLENAITEVPFLDDFNPTEMSRLTWLPRGKGGKFLLTRPGVYFFTSESYCLHAGTYAPTEGDGYLYAPIAGSRAGVIKAILERTWNRPEIKQDDIQTLIWAILAHTEIDKMDDGIRSIAYRILTKNEIMELNGGALGMISDELLYQARGKMPSALHKVFEAEAKLRNLLTVPGTSYSELERIAVLTGTPEWGKGSREIPGCRWSYHPNGYFVRYKPEGYATTFIELSVPSKLTIARDSAGRIISIADPFGKMLEITYDDSTTPLKTSGDNVMGYAFKSVKYKYRTTSHPENVWYKTEEWKNTGWAFTGMPSGKGKLNSASGKFADSQNRFKSLTNHKTEIDKLVANALKYKGKNAKRGSESDLANVIDLASIAFAIKPFLASEGADWDISPYEFIQRVWQSSVTIAAGESPVDVSKSYSLNPDLRKDYRNFVALQPYLDENPTGIPVFSFNLSGYLFNNIIAAGGDGGDDEFDACDGVACPGNTASQRIKPSNRGSGDGDPPPQKKDPCDKAQAALDNALLWLKAYSDPDTLANATDAWDYVNDVENGEEKKASEAAGHDVQASTDAAVGSDCQLYIGDKVATFDEFRDYLSGIYEGYPPEVIEAWVQHERTHMQQCMKDDNFGTDQDTRENVSKCEIEAYCVEAQMIADYMNANCEGGVSPEDQAAIDALCR